MANFLRCYTYFLDSIDIVILYLKIHGEVQSKVGGMREICLHYKESGLIYIKYSENINRECTDCPYL